VCQQADAAQQVGSLRQAYLASLVERELASPLTAIKGYAELLSRTSIAEDPAQRDRVCRALADRAREIERLLKDLALLAGLERASGLIVETADLREIVAQAASRVNAEHGSAVLRVEEAGESGSVLVDRLCAEHAFESLFRCIARAADHGDPVRVGVRTEQQSVVVTLDPAAGATEEAGVRTVRQAGLPEHVLTESGVGFHLARMAVEAHGGDLRLEPAAAIVPRIELRLPLHDGPEEAAWLVPMM
jgi:two-component system sensor histidine kinase TrcS